MKVNFLKTSYGVVEVELLCNFMTPTEQKSKGERCKVSDRLESFCESWACSSGG